jgi:hypothetical protein
MDRRIVASMAIAVAANVLPLMVIFFIAMNGN